MSNSKGVNVLDRTHFTSMDRISGLVGQIMERRSASVTAGPEDDLSDKGLSSLDMVNLMLAVEEEFDIKIPDRDMTPSNFRSIARIDRLVATLIAANGRG